MKQKRIFPVFLLMLTVILFVGCGKMTVPAAEKNAYIEIVDDKQQSPAKADETNAGQSTHDKDEHPGSHDDSDFDGRLDDDDSITRDVAMLDVLPDEDGTYSSKEDVAMYLRAYGKLPRNYITKKEAKKLGWNGGSLEPYAPGKCIGGDRFGNYEGRLPEDDDYHECDIDTLGKKSRGAKRIVYSDDGDIYYTDDHYESFELLWED